MLSRAISSETPSENTRKLWTNEHKAFTTCLTISYGNEANYDTRAVAMKPIHKIGRSWFW